MAVVFVLEMAVVMAMVAVLVMLEVVVLCVGNCKGWGNPSGLTGRVTHGWGTGYNSPTRELSNKPKNVQNGWDLDELWSKRLRQSI